MPADMPKMEASGWRTFDFTLVRGGEGRALMVSDEVIRAYMRYVTTCRDSNLKCMNFTAWLSPSLARPEASASVEA